MAWDAIGTAVGTGFGMLGGPLFSLYTGTVAGGLTTVFSNPLTPARPSGVQPSTVSSLQGTPSISKQQGTSKQVYGGVSQQQPPISPSTGHTTLSSGSSSSQSGSSTRKPSPGITSYTVKSGDTLWGIASMFYGSGFQWQRIYQANQGTIGGNPNLILPGERLSISH